MSLDWSKSIGECIQTRHQLMSSLEDRRNVDRLYQVVANSVIGKDNRDTLSDFVDHSKQAQECWDTIVQAWEISKKIQQDRLTELWYSVCNNVLDYSAHQMQLKQSDCLIRLVDSVKMTSYTRCLSISTIQITSPNNTKYSIEVVPYTTDTALIHSTLDIFVKIHSHQVRILVLDKIYIVGTDNNMLTIELCHGNPQGAHFVHALTSTNTNVNLLNHIV
ncbi:MAG: hypothetical protein LBK70_00870 [Clostridiales bacterium]|nr:hypothetical protein [Clostridiales bacterium]